MSIYQRISLSITTVLSKRRYSFAHTVTSSNIFAFLQMYTPPIPPRSTTALAVPSATIYVLPQETASLHVLIPLLHSKFPNSIGCLASSFGDCPKGEDTISIAHFWDTDRTTYRLFRSAELGKEPASVGRWRPLGERTNTIEGGTNKRDHSEGNMLEKAVRGGDWSGVWEDWKKCSSGGQVYGQISDLEGLELVDPTRIEMTLLFSTPTSLSRTIDLLPSTSPKAGLALPQTPFTTGRPHTLFFKNQIYEQGAVGLAIVSEKEPDVRRREGVTMHVEWEGMEPVENQVYKVVSSQGNLLLSISPCVAGFAHTISNPTKHLIALLQKSPSAGFDHKSYLGSKEKEFFLGFLQSREPELGRDDLGSGEGSTQDVTRVVRILSGDPGRGGMAIEREDSLQVGERFMFIHRPSIPRSRLDAQDESHDQNLDESRLTSHTFVFRTSSTSTSSPSLVGSANEANPISNSSRGLSDHSSIEGFDCSSESGFIVSLSPGEEGEAGRAFADKGIEGGRVVVRLDE